MAERVFCCLWVGGERRDELRQVGTGDLADLGGQAWDVSWQDDVGGVFPQVVRGAADGVLLAVGGVAGDASKGADKGGGKVTGESGDGLAGASVEVAAEAVVAVSDAEYVTGQVLVAEGVARQADGGLAMASHALYLPRSSQDWIAGITGDGIVTVCDPRLNKPAARVEDLQQVAELLAVHVLSLTTRAESATIALIVKLPLTIND